MNEREYHALLRDWLRAEAPPEAPDWVIQQALDRTQVLERQPRPILWRAPWQLAWIALVLGLVLVGGLAVLAGILRQPPQPVPTPRAAVVRDIPVGQGIILGVTHGPGGIWIASSSLPGAVLLDPQTGERLTEVQTYASPPPASASRHPLAADVVFAFDSIWTVDDEFDTVSRIDPESGRPLGTIAVGTYPRAAAAAGGALWVLSPLQGTLSRIDPATERATEITLPVSAPDTGDGHIVGNDTTLWLAVGDELLSVDPQTSRVVHTVAIEAPVEGLAVGDAIWAISSLGLTRVDPATGEVLTTVPVGGSPSAIAIAGDLVWVADLRDRTLRGVDPQTETVVETVAIGAGPTDIAVSGSSMAVLNQVDGSVTLIQLPAD